MAAPRVLISDPLDPVCASILKQKGVHFDQLKLTKDELLNVIKVKPYFLFFFKYITFNS